MLCLQRSASQINYPVRDLKCKIRSQRSGTVLANDTNIIQNTTQSYLLSKIWTVPPNQNSYCACSELICLPKEMTDYSLRTCIHLQQYVTITVAWTLVDY